MIEVVKVGESRLMVLNVTQDRNSFDLGVFSGIFIYLKSASGQKFIIKPHEKSKLDKGLIYWDLTPELTSKPDSYIGRLIVKDNSGNYFVLRSKYVGDKFIIAVEDSACYNIEDIIEFEAQQN